MHELVNTVEINQRKKQVMVQMSCFMTLPFELVIWFLCTAHCLMIMYNCVKFY